MKRYENKRIRDLIKRNKAQQTTSSTKIALIASRHKREITIRNKESKRRDKKRIALPRQ